MDEGSTVHIHNGILVTLKKRGNPGKRRKKEKKEINKKIF